ncbi:MAG: chemotaxis protein CheW [Chloroflexota bacterium]
MLIVRFGLGERAFGIRAREVREILPLVRVRPSPGVPDWVAGELLLGGSPVPVIDLRRWLDGVPSREDLATRLLLLDWKGAGGSGPVAFIVERVRETVDVPAGAISRRTAGAPDERVLGGSFVQDGTIVQLLDPRALVTTELGAVLYPVRVA